MDLHVPRFSEVLRSSMLNPKGGGGKKIRPINVAIPLYGDPSSVAVICRKRNVQDVLRVRQIALETGI